MKNRKSHIEARNPEKTIEEKYSASYMNNTKWNKLIEKLTDEIAQIYVNYKLIYSDEVNGFMFITPDFEPFFIEPILYKEIEWIEFPTEYEDWVNENNRKAGKITYQQDLHKLNEEINKIGKFELETYEDSIRLYGYK